LVLKVHKVFRAQQVLQAHKVRQALAQLVLQELLDRLVLQVHKVQLVSVSQFTGSTQTTQRWLLRNLLVNLATDTLQKMEISGYGTQRQKTGTMLVTLKAQQVRLEQTVQLAQQVHKVRKVLLVLQVRKVSRVTSVILVRKVQQVQQVHKDHKALKVFKETLAQQVQLVRKALLVLQV
jgi:glyoxylate carboligase